MVSDLPKECLSGVLAGGAFAFMVFLILVCFYFDGGFKK